MAMSMAGEWFGLRWAGLAHTVQTDQGGPSVGSGESGSGEPAGGDELRKHHDLARGQQAGDDGQIDVSGDSSFGSAGTLAL